MKEQLENYNSDITRHFAIAKRAYDCGMTFGTELMSSISSELKDYRIKINEEQCLDLIEELFIKGTK